MSKASVLYLTKCQQLADLQAIDNFISISNNGQIAQLSDLNTHQ